MLHNVYMLWIFMDNILINDPRELKKNMAVTITTAQVFIASLWPTLQYGQQTKSILLTMWTVTWFLSKIFALDKNLIPYCTFENLVLKVFALSCNPVIWIKINFLPYTSNSCFVPLRRLLQLFQKEKYIKNSMGRRATFF